jgi:RND family efflux transporter MFP subunit
MIVLAVVAFLFVWYVVADRLAPWTDQARVKAFVVPVIPQVTGRVINVNVTQDQIVQEGDLLIEIDPADYELAVQNAESSLALAGQDIGASTASVVTAETRLVEAQVNLDYEQKRGSRTFELEKKGIKSKSDGDRARAQIDQARVARTKIYAPSQGGITNLQVDVGHYASPGVPLMTFISVDDVWIQANFRENSVANIKSGDSVDIALDVAPGRIFNGTVSSVGFAVDHSKGGAVGDLASVEGNSGWLRDAQRFPVVVHFDDDSARGYRRLGGQADVQVYTSGNFIINTLGWLWIRLLSVLSFVY